MKDTITKWILDAKLKSHHAFLVGDLNGSIAAGSKRSHNFSDLLNDLDLIAPFPVVYLPHFQDDASFFWKDAPVSNIDYIMFSPAGDSLVEFIECGNCYASPSGCLFTDHALLWTRIQFPAMPPLPTPTIFATRRRHDLPLAKDGPAAEEKINAFQEDMTKWTEQHTPALMADCTPQQALLAQMHCQILSSAKNVYARDGNRLCVINVDDCFRVLPSNLRDIVLDLINPLEGFKLLKTAPIL
jgi:hypothetical protein